MKVYYYGLNLEKSTPHTMHTHHTNVRITNFWGIKPTTTTENKTEQ